MEENMLRSQTHNILAIDLGPSAMDVKPLKCM